MQQHNLHAISASAMALQTVAAVNISARLFLAQKSAAKLSLTAKNLSVIAARIGVDAAGLKVLSGFYDQFAQNAIKVAGDINRLAQRIARNTMVRWRCHLFSQKVAVLLANNSNEQGLLNKSFQQAIAREQQLQQGNLSQCRQLERLLAELLDYMMTMQVIAVNARIEACSLSGYQLQLTQLAEAIERNSSGLLADITHCQFRLKELLLA
ncbi:hypothetical protein ORJ04_18285 [Rheinheimera baltica]|uniref:Methyl-accepting chemotaxis protein n=1 Tax=Rheinheimera baltica TaxID=67576 RepID=A0ABT9I3E8_9GAMM|nr:hypothetical protein [Rheinheimera baltica]MDP5137904.1 hypothetical protein [Rheinheimera baltica]